MALKDILDQIKKSADHEVKQIEAEAASKAEAMASDFAQQLKQKKADIKKSSDDKALRLSDQASRRARGELSSKVLRMKRDYMDNLYEKSLNQILESKDQEAMIVQLLEEALSSVKEGHITPGSVSAAHVEHAVKKMASGLKLEAPSKTFKGGFKISSPIMDIDASFETILKEEMWDEIEMKLNKQLFS
jgi:vacuolar-type H+-ATPase subunit E/Vma4